MEATLQSPPAPAKEADPRAELLRITGYNRSHIGGPMVAENWTFCSCCGSQYLKADGTVGTGQMWAPPDKEGVMAAFEKTWGPRWKERLGEAWETQVTKVQRLNKPGVTFAFMDKDKAISILYDEEHRHLADGYNIDDKDQGHICSVVWMNA